MIAIRARMLGMLVTAVLLAGAGAPAWAQDAQQPTPNWSALDAEVERGVAAYDAGDYARAKEILLPLAERGHPKAMNIVGRMHEKSDVFPDDPVIKCDWYERSANAGYASAMHNLSICYYLGKGRPKDSELDLHWSTMAANHGSINAMIGMASLDTNQGLEYRRWMNKAAEHGSRYAMVGLWLQGYKDDAWKQGMTIQDFICVSWHVLILDKDAKYCD